MWLKNYIIMNNTINERVAAAIEELGLTANSFASKLGVASSVIYNSVRGKTKPSYELIEKMVLFFNISPAYLINGKGDILTIRDRSRFDNMFDDQMNIDLEKMQHIIKIDQPLTDKFVKLADATKMVNDYTDIMGDADLTVAYLTHYNASIYMISIAKEYRLGKITIRDFKLKFKERIELQRQLYKEIKPFEKAIKDMFEVVSKFNDKHDKLYDLHDED